MYFFGLSKEEVLSQKHVVSYKETFDQNPVTILGRQVYPVNSKSSKSVDGSLKMKDIDLRLPADHYDYVETRFHSASEAKVLAKNWSGKRDPRIVIDLEELPTTEDADSVSNKTTNMEVGLLDLNRSPEPRFCFLQDLNCPYIEEIETSCEKSGVDDDPTLLCSPKGQNLHEKNDTSSPASYTSCCTTENNLRRDPSCRTRLEFPVLPENECSNEEEEEEFSEVMLMAAESLVHISAVSYQNQDFQDKPEKGNVEPRCCSCDSYELHTLGISETNTEEEFCVSSMALDKLNNITKEDNKEFGLKLRRGRRMKNFPKEILPNLTSLSRHEIREDMNILEAVLRSREYKKMQGKTKDVNLGANTRNKRLVSQRYVGKRR